MNVECFETSGAPTFVVLSVIVVEKSRFSTFLTWAFFLLPAHARFTHDLLKAENCSLYIKNEVDLKRFSMF